MEKRKINPVALALFLAVALTIMSLVAPVEAKKNNVVYGDAAFITGAITAGSMAVTTLTPTTANITTANITNANVTKVVASQYVAVTSATAIVALSTGTTVPITKGYVVVASSGGAVTLESNPQIAAGVTGQLLTIQGSSDTNVPTLADGNGLVLTGAMALGAGDTITLIYSPAIAGGGAWVEIARANN